MMNEQARQATLSLMHSPSACSASLHFGRIHSFACCSPESDFVSFPCSVSVRNRARNMRSNDGISLRMCAVCAVLSTFFI